MEVKNERAVEKLGGVALKAFFSITEISVTIASIDRENVQSHPWLVE